MMYRGRTCAKTVGTVAGVLLLAGSLAGCKENGSLVSRMSDESKARLQQVPAGGEVVVSVRASMAAAPADRTLLEGGGRELGRAGNSVLVLVPRSSLDRFGGLDAITDVVVWGGSDIAAILDPLLRGRILEALDDPDTREAPLPMIATFSSPASELEAELRERGAAVRTITGGVVTLDAPPEAAFRILSMPNLRSLGQPRPVQWMREE